jgi:uncharacterized cofD-like protein
MNKKHIVTIGWWNGQSNLLDGLYEYYKTEIHLSSIVSMSDDGRTTGQLMKLFEEELGIHLPPPGDLRRCLFMMSDSPRRDEFQKYLETTIEKDFPIQKLTLWEYFSLVGAKEDFYEFLKNTHPEILWYKLPLKASSKGHKVGNLVMASLYYNLDTDYQKMLEVMHQLLEVKASIIPVTTKKAYIKAILWNGEEIETQDRISNVASYSSGIADLVLMEDSKHAYQHKDVFKAIKKADTIIITPWDLFTSIISNFVIGGVKEVIGKSDAKIIYIGNSTNKWGETQWLTHLDFINKIERFLGRTIDMFICNNKRVILSEWEKESFRANVSVKWGDFLYLSSWERIELERRKIKCFEADLLDKETLYKHDKKKLVKILENTL